MRLLYTTRRLNFPEGFSARHPNYFVKPEAAAKQVFIEGNYPVIAKAYQELGVPVETFGEKATAAKESDAVASEQDKTEVEAVAMEQVDVKALDDMTVDELQAYLNELGVDFDAKAKKADLLKLAKE